MAACRFEYGAEYGVAKVVTETIPGMRGQGKLRQGFNALPIAWSNAIFVVSIRNPAEGLEDLTVLLAVEIRHGRWTGQAGGVG